MFFQRISPPWVWSWMGPFAGSGLPFAQKRGVVDDELVVQPDRGARPHLEDSELVPLAEGLVREHERVLAGRPRSVVPEAARALVGADVPLPAGLGGVPDLDLGHAAQVDAAVGLGDGLVLDEQFDVAVVLRGRGVLALPVVDEFAVLGFPVRPHVRGPLVALLLALLRHLARVGRVAAHPALQVLPVEERGEARGRLLLQQDEGGREGGKRHVSISVSTPILRRAT
jgi:hypothetical protein